MTFAPHKKELPTLLVWGHNPVDNHPEGKNVDAPFLAILPPGRCARATLNLNVPSGSAIRS